MLPGPPINVPGNVVQRVEDMENAIRNFVIRYPGSMHQACVGRTRRLCDRRCLGRRQ